MCHIINNIDMQMQLSSVVAQVLARGFDNNLVIERIAILGLGDRKSKWTAEVQGTKQALDVSWGPLYMRPGLPNAALVVRKPDLQIAKDWVLRLKQI